MRRIIPILFLAALAGCQTTQPSGETLGAICRAATVSLNAASSIKPRLSVQTRADVAHGVSIVDPFCSQETPPTLDTLAQIALTVALTELLTDQLATPEATRSATAVATPLVDWPPIRDAWRAAVVRWNAA